VVGNLGEVRFGLTASPDGRRVLFSRLEVSLADVMLVENFQ
jgi:hypothetical protein